MREPSEPIRSTILLYLASLPQGQVAWGQRIAAELRAKKLPNLSPNTVYSALEDFRSKLLVELVNPRKSHPATPTEALVNSAYTDEDRKRLEISRRLLRAGYTQGDLKQLDQERKMLHELERKDEKKHMKRQFSGLAGLRPHEVKWLVEEKKRTGFRPPDPRAKLYLLTTTGRKVAELMKQKDLLTEWWSCRESPTENPQFLAKLRARGFEPSHVDAAVRTGMLSPQWKQPEEHPGSFTYSIETSAGIAQAFAPHIIGQGQAIGQRRCRYQLM